MDPNIKQVVIKCPEGYEVDYEHSTFEYIKFKKIEKQLPKTWEEFCETHPIKQGESYVSSGSAILEASFTQRDSKVDKNLLPSKKYAMAMCAICQLIQLRDCYNDGWEPNWTDGGEYKYTIYSTVYGKIVVGIHNVTPCMLSFKTEELRDTFFENFKDLIEIAKPLL